MELRNRESLRDRGPPALDEPLPTARRRRARPSRPALPCRLGGCRASKAMPSAIFTPAERLSVRRGYDGPPNAGDRLGGVNFP